MKVGRIEYPLTDEKIGEITKARREYAKECSEKGCLAPHRAQLLEDVQYDVETAIENWTLMEYSEGSHTAQEVRDMEQYALEHCVTCVTQLIHEMARYFWDAARRVNPFYAEYMAEDLIYDTLDHSPSYNSALKTLYYKEVCLGKNPTEAYKNARDADPHYYHKQLLARYEKLDR
jgi:hypothetical protein